MYARLIGGVRTTYPYADGYGMLNYPDNTEVAWIKEFVVGQDTVGEPLQSVLAGEDIQL